MVRYIDADALLEQLNKKKSEVGKARYTDGFNDAILCVRSMVSRASTADVVPKSEYDNLKSQFEALDHECDRLERAESNRHDTIEQAKHEVAREIFAEIENTINNELQNNHKVLPQVEFSNEIWNGISGRINALQGIRDFIAELKKKYTEDQT